MSNKITKATLKSFVRKNAERLYIRNLSDFDGMTDCVQQCKDSGFRKATPADNPNNESHTLGIAGIWLVGQSRDWFQPFEKDGYQGIEVSNSCGNFIVAVREQGGETMREIETATVVTERPWRVNHRICIESAEGDYIAKTLFKEVSPEQADAHAAHIVRCVNSHEALVDALRQARDGITDPNRGPSGPKYVLEVIDAALAAAGE